MYLKYVTQNVEAEKKGMIEVGKFYKALSCNGTTVAILDDADDKLEIPLENMGIIANNTKVKLVKDMIYRAKDTIGYVDSNITNLVAAQNSTDIISVSYRFTPADDEELVILCDREDFEPLV